MTIDVEYKLLIQHRVIPLIPWVIGTTLWYDSFWSYDLMAWFYVMIRFGLMIWFICEWNTLMA